jgi:hypothetical protein
VVELRKLASLAERDEDRGRRWAAHLHSRRLRGSLWSLDAPPWDDRTALTDREWDLQWRLAFGGIPESLRLRIDRPAERHGWRGKVMEHVVADALSACVPAGVLRTTLQPITELQPVDHLMRCQADGVDLCVERRADIAVDFRDAHRLVIDVASTNVVCDSALSKSVLTHMEGIESIKDRRYKGYYREFHPLVVSLGGGVTERGWGVIKRICRSAARLSSPRLPWEPYEWALRVLRHIAAGMARVIGWIATRVPADASDDCSVRAIDTEQGRALALFPPSAGGSQDAHGLGARLADPVGEVLLLPVDLVDGGCGAVVVGEGGGPRP